MKKSIQLKYNVALFFMSIAALTVDTVGVFPFLCFVSLAIAGGFILSAKLDEERKERKDRRRAEIAQMRKDAA